MKEGRLSPFNSALETGVRTVAILVASHPAAHDLGRLVQYDYLTVHSADAGGPPSLHPPLPLRSGELLVRRGLIEAGLRLMMSRSLVRRIFRADGFLYMAEESAGAFVDNMQSAYMVELRSRAIWVTDRFDALDAAELGRIVRNLFEVWSIEFQPVQHGVQTELPW